MTGETSVTPDEVAATDTTTDTDVTNETDFMASVATVPETTTPTRPRPPVRTSLGSVIAKPPFTGATQTNDRRD